MSSPELELSGERLQKVLAASGVASRRASEELIAAGRVSVNGTTVDRMGMRVDPHADVIRVDGARVVLDKSAVYIALHKPRGVVSAMSDDLGRPSLADYVSDVKERVFHVGRLDYDSEGLLLLTNDGELAHRLTHPSFEVPKTYVCEVAAPVWPRIRKQLLAGVELEDGIVTVDAFKVVQTAGDRAIVEISLHSGKNRVIRRLLEAVGYPVSRLVRTQFGVIALARLRAGTFRKLSVTEVGELYKAAGL